MKERMLCKYCKDRLTCKVNPDECKIIKSYDGMNKYHERLITDDQAYWLKDKDEKENYN